MGPDRDRLRRFAVRCRWSVRRSLPVCSMNCCAAGNRHASGPWLHLPDHQVRLNAEDEVLWQQLQPLFALAGFDPPWVRDVAKALAQEDAVVRLLLRKLARLGLMHQVVRDLFYQ
jgi:selenocysteine-specific elongation factor